MVNEWISVKDKLPETDTDVLIYIAEYHVTDFARCLNKKFYDDSLIDISEVVTHWFPLPEPPIDNSER